MHNRIYDIYIGWKKEKRKSTKEICGFLWKQKRIQMIMLIILMAMSVLLMVFTLLKMNSYGVIVMILEILLVIAMSYQSGRNDIRVSKQSLEEYRKQCTDFLEMLSKNGIKEKTQIKQLRNEMNRDIEKYEDDNRRQRKNIDIIFSVFVMPVILVFLSVCIQHEENLVAIFLFVFEILLILIAIYGGVMAFFLFFKEILDYKNNSKKIFVDDLQGVLDTKFKIKESDLIN